jgi:hypothetical protein
MTMMATSRPASYHINETNQDSHSLNERKINKPIKP